MSSKKGNSDDERWIAMGCYPVDSRCLLGKLLLCAMVFDAGWAQNWAQSEDRSAHRCCASFIEQLTCPVTALIRHVDYFRVARHSGTDEAEFRPNLCRQFY